VVSRWCLESGPPASRRLPPCPGRSATGRDPVPRAIAADELAKRAHSPGRYRLDAADLARWLLEERLAVERGELLEPTRRALELGESLRGG
jgi:hypothetical protein